MHARRLAPTIPMVLAFAACASAQPADADALVEAERRFAADVAALGMRDGFLAHLAADAIVFQPGPVDAVPAYEAREPGSASLEWVPAFAEIAAAGDLGWTTGPWIYRPEAGGEIVAGGHYVSLWRAAEDGTRRVALDVGIVHAPPTLAAGEAATRTLPARSGTPETDPDLRASLEAAEREFAAAAGRSLAEAYRGVGAADLRTYRMGAEPAVGLEAAAVAAAAFGPLTWRPSGARTSADGGLGYVWGAASAPPGDAAGYLRIWRRAGSGSWELALDLATVPPPTTP